MADGNTIAEQIADIAASKAAIAQAISAKGVTVPEGAKLADLAPLVGQISGGGGAEDTCSIDRTGMNELVIPDGVTKIGTYAFYNCVALASLIISGSVTSIGERAFSEPKSLKFLTIPGNVTNIGSSAFSGCFALTSLIIQEGVKSIRNNVFYACSALIVMMIPASVTSIGSGAFSGCPSSCNITFAKTMAEVSGMSNYPWGITAGAVIHCTDGDLTVG